MTRLVLFELYLSLICQLTSEDIKHQLIIFELFVTNLLLFEHQQKNCSLADSFMDPMA